MAKHLAIAAASCVFECVEKRLSDEGTKNWDKRNMHSSCNLPTARVGVTLVPLLVSERKMGISVINRHPKEP